jgi:GTP cyclohydrolase IA
MTTTSADPRQDGREPLPAKPLDRDRAEAAIRELLYALGQGDKAEVMENTPRRVTDLYEEQINAPWVDIEPGFKVFEANGYSELIIVNDCHYVSMCEHHLAPAFGVAHFSYIPDGYVVGYSKIKKALNYLARQPQLNERLVEGALDFVEERLRPAGIGLVLRSIHTCLACKANAPSQEVVTVQGLRGQLKEDPWRREFMASVYAAPPSFLA